MGLENHRFFLLFNFYLLLGLIYSSLSVYSIKDNYVFKYIHHDPLSFILVLDTILLPIFIFYNLYIWFLAVVGVTNVEFIAQTTGHRANNYDFSFSHARDNLFKIFGTLNFIRMFSASLRLNSFSGIEWSFQMKELGFNEYGECEREGDRKRLTQSSSLEMSRITDNPYDDDKDGSLEAEDAEI